MGDVIQLLSQVIGSFVVAFYLCWQLTVVLLAAFPAIVLSAGYMINAITAATTKSLGPSSMAVAVPLLDTETLNCLITIEQYAAAGGLATESLNAIRTVTALNMQPDVVSRYRVFLFKAMQVNTYQQILSYRADILYGNSAGWNS